MTKISFVLSIDRDFSYRCYSARVLLNIFVTIESLKQEIFRNKTENIETLTIDGLKPNKDYKISVEACPAYNESLSPPCSDTTELSVRTKKDVPLPPRSFRYSHETLQTTATSRNVRLHWQCVAEEDSHGDELAYVVRFSADTEVETQNCYLDLSSLSLSETRFQVFSKNEVGVSEDYVEIIAEKYEKVDDSVNVMILDYENNSSIVLKSSSASGDQNPDDIIISWCGADSRTSSCESGIDWISVNSSHLYKNKLFQLDLPEHVSFAFLSLRSDSRYHGMKIIHCRASVDDEFESSLRMKSTGTTSLEFSVDISVCDSSRDDVTPLIMTSARVQLCSLLSPDQCSTSVSASASVTLTDLRPGTCYSSSHSISQPDSRNMSIVSQSQVFCTAPDTAPSIVRAFQVTSSSVAVILSQPSDNAPPLWLYPCQYQVEHHDQLVTLDTCEQVSVLTSSSSGHHQCQHVRVRVGSDGGESPWSDQHQVTSPPLTPTINIVSSGVNDTLVVHYSGETSDQCEVSVDNDQTLTISPPQCPVETLESGCCPQTIVESSVSVPVSAPEQCGQVRVKIRCSNTVIIDQASLNHLHDQHLPPVTDNTIIFSSDWSTPWIFNSTCPQDETSLSGALHAALVAAVLLTLVFLLVCFFSVRHIYK